MWEGGGWAAGGGGEGGGGGGGGGGDVCESLLTTDRSLGGPPTERGDLLLGRVGPTAQGESKVLVSCGPRRKVANKDTWCRKGPTFRLEETNCPTSLTKSPACPSEGAERGEMGLIMKEEYCGM